MKNDYFNKIKGNKNEDLQFMEWAKKGDIESILNKPCYLTGFGVARGKDGEYSIFMVDADKEHFFLAGQVVTDKFKQVDNDGMHKELKEELIEFKKVESKNGRFYIDFDFVE